MRGPAIGPRTVYAYAPYMQFYIRFSNHKILHTILKIYVFLNDFVNMPFLYDFVYINFHKEFCKYTFHILYYFVNIYIVYSLLFIGYCLLFMCLKNTL